MNKLLFFIILMFFPLLCSAQKHLTRNGNISFFSSTPIEDIEAHNKQASCVIDYGKNELAFQVLMKGFEFKKALMQEHFNENYVESSKYPKATFSGKLKNFDAENLKKDGLYKVSAEGDLTIHGVKKKVNVEGTIEVKGNQSHLKSKFKVAPKDYNIKIPSVVRQNISEIIDVTVDMLCMPLAK